MPEQEVLHVTLEADIYHFMLLREFIHYRCYLFAAVDMRGRMQVIVYRAQEQQVVLLHRGQYPEPAKSDLVPAVDGCNDPALLEMDVIACRAFCYYLG